MNIPQALFRGASAAEFALIGDRGLPIDVGRYQCLAALGNNGLRQLWQDHLDHHHVMVNGSFDHRKYAELIAQSGIPWPRTDTGCYRSDKETLKEMSLTNGEPWKSIYELKRSIAGGVIDGLQLRPHSRLYAAPKPFMTITGRSAPSTSEFVYLGPKWLRSLLQPPPGRTLMELDWGSQEYGIAAALSQDPAMLEAYLSGDPYIHLAKLAGGVPDDADATSHPKERDAFKIVSLAVLMGMGAGSVGRKTGKGLFAGEQLMRQHREIFKTFWKWSDAVHATGAAARDIETAFGLVYNPRSYDQYKPRTARNFLLQATGSDMLRVAILLLAEAGIEVVATVHDSVVVECDTADACNVQKMAIECMEEASRITLWDRLTIRVDSPKIDPAQGEVKRVNHPHHFQDKKGIVTWRDLSRHLNLVLDEHGG